MNIFHKIACTSLRRNRRQTAVTAVGVALSTALIAAVATLAVSLQSYLVKGMEAKYGGWQVEFPAAEADFAAGQAENPLVKSVVTLQNIGYAALEDGANPDKPYLFVSGWDDAAFAALPLKMIAGRLPQNGGEVVIPAHLAANGGVSYAVGDTLTLAVGARLCDGAVLSQHDAYRSGETLTDQTVKTYTVVGICQRPAQEEYSAPGYTLITAADPAFGGGITAFVTLQSPYRLAAYRASLPDGVAIVLNEDVLQLMGIAGSPIILTLLYTVTAILAALVVLGSVFLIYNAFNITLGERTHQLGILMSVGATARQLRHSVLFEALCIGAVGIPLGLCISLPGVGLLLRAVRNNFANILYPDIPLTLQISPLALLAGAGVSLVTLLFSAGLPARRATRVPVMDCLRQTREVKAAADTPRPSRLARRFLGLEEQLALKNFQRNRRRYRSIVLSLTFSIVLMVSSGSFGDYLDQAAVNASPVFEDYDIVFTSRDLPQSDLVPLYSQLAAADGVTQSGYQIEARYPCTLQATELSEELASLLGISSSGAGETVDAMLDVVFLDADAYRAFRDAHPLPDGQSGALLLAAYDEDGYAAQTEGLTVSLPGADGTLTFQAATVADMPDRLPGEANGGEAGYTLLLIAPYTEKARFDALNTAEDVNLGMTFSSDSPAATAEQMQAILDANSLRFGYSLYNLRELTQQNRNLTFVINLFSAVFVVMIALIATANVLNTISTNIRVRRRELAMLRSVGMDEAAFDRMMRFECLLYGARTLAWGLPLSLAVSYGIYAWMQSDVGGLRFVLPLGRMLAGSEGVLAIVFVTMLYATARIRRENIIDALRDDTL